MNLFSEKPLYEPSEILLDAVERYQPTHIFGMFSGGRDSLVACHMASYLQGFSGCFHANTGIGIERTREYVRQTCRDYGWHLVELHPPKTYEEFVSEFGFPGPAMHGMVYNRLKERCVRDLVRIHKQNRHDNIMLVSGIRQQESRRRMGYDDPTQKRDSQIWVNPIFYWSRERRDLYIKSEGLPCNPVADALGMSGECLCGAFAGSKGELPESELRRIAIIDSSVPKEIERLSRIAKAHGKPCRWGYAPPRENERDIREALELEGQTFMPLCSSCHFNKEK
ncbi:MAG TPA: phosphoadenosine phosphosulfate reductase family protein [Capsulimonadaceae bacterium]|nr:phosphoadenosine phosphosulfate reductase family protein [Capsulimonadaceae bacterium]